MNRNINIRMSLNINMNMNMNMDMDININVEITERRSTITDIRLLCYGVHGVQSRTDLNVII
jgi:hypothetical protein